MAQNNQEALLKELVEKIQQFFSHQIQYNNSLGEAAKEGLTVAAECIEQAYNIQRKPGSQDLLDIYKAHKQSTSQAPGAGIQDPTQLLANIAGSIFPGIVGGLSNPTPGAQSGRPQQQQQQQQQQTTQAPTSNQNQEQSNAQPKKRKQATAAEKLAAESFKNQGNDCMKQDKYKEAYDYYTQAIEIDDNNAIYYSNRAAALSKIGDHEGALRDCKEAIEIDPNYSKAYGRMGLAYASLENHAEAKEAYVKAVELDPNNESYQNNLNIAEAKLAEQRSGPGVTGSAGSGGAPGANVMGMLHSMMTNPQVMSMAMQSLQDPRIQGMFGLGGQTTGASTPNGGQQTQSTEQHQSATSAPANQQTAGNRQANTGQQETQNQANSNEQQQVPPFNPADLLNLTSRIAGSANVDLVGAGQQLLSSIQENNPQLVDNMRRMMSQAFMNPNGPGSGNQNNDNPPPGYS